MDEYRKHSIKVSLPRYSSVGNAILKYSSLVVLNTGKRFRICNVCGIKLEADLSKQHTKHLRIHERAWRSYKKKVGEYLRESIKKHTDDIETQNGDNENKDSILEVSSSSDSEEEINLYNVVDTLGPSFGNRPPPWTFFEKKQLNKFTYDKHPVREFREFSDIHVISMCNTLKCHQINDILGPGSDLDLMDPNRLYVPNSETVNKIARLLCPKQCYFDPGECFFGDEHVSDFKDLLKKDLHDRLNPTFTNILNENTKKNFVLKYDVDNLNRPKVDELCEEIGFTTSLAYNKDGFVDLNYDLFCKQLWDHDTPLFVIEEKKVLDTILGLLIAAPKVYSSRRDQISDKYAQNLPGVNKPVLSIMHHGPRIRRAINHTSTHCNTERDERRSTYQTYVSHPHCKNYTEEDYWKYKHNDTEEVTPKEPSSETSYSLCGPASLLDQTIVYPCDRGHWHQCECESCTLLRSINCTNHKIHMKHNIKRCLIKEMVDCDEHHIDHPENFQPGDVEIRKCIMYHNKELFKGGRNYRSNVVILAGFKCKCNKCRKKIQDHFAHHHVLHAHCEICLFESKTSEDLSFWDRVCKICGKKYDNEYLKDIHLAKHNKEQAQCEYCGNLFVSKFTYQRHLIEQHDIHQQANNGPYDGNQENDNFNYECTICMKEFKYERNVYAHMYTVHYKRDVCECRICGRNITNKSNLKRHLCEQHNLLNLERELPRESFEKFQCDVCFKHFNRKATLNNHIIVHEQRRMRYECDQCDETFSLIKNLRRHQKLHSDELEGYQCNICKVEFLRKSNLKEHMQTHEPLRQEFKCRKCPKIFFAQRTLTRHMIMHH